MATSAFRRSAASDVPRAAKTTLPLPSTVFTSVKPADSKAPLSAGILQFMEGHEPLQPKGLHHYDLHVWLWKDNPAGIFSPTNPAVKCPKGSYSFTETAPKLVDAAQ